MTSDPEQGIAHPDPEDGLSVERLDEISRQLNAISHALSTIDGQLSTITDLLATEPSRP
jgi:hypothetical protein